LPVARSHQSVVVSVVSITTSTSSWRVNSSATSITTLCDGHPRVAVPSSAAILEHFNSTYITDQLVTISSYTGSPPACSIKPDSCSSLTTSYLSAIKAWDSFRSAELEDVDLAFQTEAFFSKWASTAWPYDGACDGNPKKCGERCVISARKAQLLYFPVTVTGDECHRTTVPAQQTISGLPNTAVVGGTTFTSGFVYVSFDKIWAQPSMGRPSEGCMTTTSNVLVSLPANQLSSYGSGPAFQPTWYTMNYADLAGPYPPFSVYEHAHGASCDPEILGNANLTGPWASHNRQWCQTFTAPYEHGGYQPTLFMGQIIKALPPMWAACDVGPIGVFDPPIALVPATQLLAQETRALDRITVSRATPGPTVNPPSPANTKLAVTPIIQGNGGGKAAGASSLPDLAQANQPRLPLTKAGYSNNVTPDHIQALEEVDGDASQVQDAAPVATVAPTSTTKSVVSGDGRNMPRSSSNGGNNGTSQKHNSGGKSVAFGSWRSAFAFIFTLFWL